MCEWDLCCRCNDIVLEGLQIERTMKGRGNMFFRRKQKFYASNLKKYIEEFQNGDIKSLPWIFCSLTQVCSKHKVTAAHVLCEALETLSFDDICKVDILMRQTTSMEWYINWKELTISNFTTKQMSEEEKRAVIIFSSFHPNGFIRQQAAEFLCSYQNTLAYIILRLNDWVANVRNSAFLSLAKMTETATGGRNIRRIAIFHKASPE